MAFKDESQIKFNECLLNEYVLLDDKIVYNNLIYSDKFNLCFPASVMLAERYREIDCIKLFEKYSKFSDGIFLQSFLNANKIAIINNFEYFYRLHSGQDTNDSSTDLTKEQFLAFLDSLVADKFKYWNAHMKVWRLKIWYNYLRETDKKELSLGMIIEKYTSLLNLYLFLIHEKRKENLKLYLLWNLYKPFYKISNSLYTRRMKCLISKYTKKFD